MNRTAYKHFIRERDGEMPLLLCVYEFVRKGEKKIKRDEKGGCLSFALISIERTIAT